jgi:hypothetical protein
MSLNVLTVADHRRLLPGAAAFQVPHWASSDRPPLWSWVHLLRRGATTEPIAVTAPARLSTSSTPCTVSADLDLPDHSRLFRLVASRDSPTTICGTGLRLARDRPDDVHRHGRAHR